ncbi:MAG: hypothetical protein Roseis2KO_23650 [Roseivirga sp.]
MTEKTGTEGKSVVKETEMVRIAMDIAMITAETTAAATGGMIAGTETEMEELSE